MVITVDKVNEHTQRHEIVEIEHFPEHDKRNETHTFINSKKQLERVEHQGCFVCGTHEHLESHHLFERAYANALELGLVARFLFDHFDFHGHCKRDFDNGEELFEFLSGFKQADEALDTVYNQLILCKQHHRDGSTGIHCMSTPSFFAWLARKEGFEPTLKGE
jgi:hypothetical protein